MVTVAFDISLVPVPTSEAEAAPPLGRRRPGSYCSLELPGVKGAVTVSAADASSPLMLTEHQPSSSW
jgi:hypothetical protein